MKKLTQLISSFNSNTPIIDRSGARSKPIYRTISRITISRAKLQDQSTRDKEYTIKKHGSLFSNIFHCFSALQPTYI